MPSPKVGVAAPREGTAAQPSGETLKESYCPIGFL